MKRERQFCRYIRTCLGKRIPRYLNSSVRFYRAFLLKIFQTQGVNLDFRGVKKRQGGWGKKFSHIIVTKLGLLQMKMHKKAMS
jgi:hypothetical protein